VQRNRGEDGEDRGWSSTGQLSESAGEILPHSEVVVDEEASPKKHAANERRRNKEEMKTN
jgi:hypothetical protein